MVAGNAIITVVTVLGHPVFHVWKCLTNNTNSPPPSAHWRLVAVTTAQPAIDTVNGVAVGSLGSDPVVGHVLTLISVDPGQATWEAPGGGGGSGIVLPSRQVNTFVLGSSKIGDVMLDPAFMGSGDYPLYQATSDPFAAPPAACWALLPFGLQYPPAVWDDTTTWLVGKACAVYDYVNIGYNIWKVLAENTNDPPPSANWLLVAAPDTIPPLPIIPMRSLTLGVPWGITTYDGNNSATALTVQQPVLASITEARVTVTGCVPQRMLDLSGGYRRIIVNPNGNNFTSAELKATRIADADGVLTAPETAGNELHLVSTVAGSGFPEWDTIPADNASFTTTDQFFPIVAQAGWYYIDATVTWAI
jgi:hypothetical protein